MTKTSFDINIIIIVVIIIISINLIKLLFGLTFVL